MVNHGTHLSICGAILPSVNLEGEKVSSVSTTQSIHFDSMLDWLPRIVVHPSYGMTHVLYHCLIDRDFSTKNICFCSVSDMTIITSFTLCNGSALESWPVESSAKWMYHLTSITASLTIAFCIHGTFWTIPCALVYLHGIINAHSFGG
jgi:hypothetical protein